MLLVWKSFNNMKKKLNRNHLFWDQLRDQRWSQFRDQLDDQLWDQLCDQLDNQLWDQQEFRNEK